MSEVSVRYILNIGVGNNIDRWLVEFVYKEEMKELRESLEGKEKKIFCVKWYLFKIEGKDIK